MRRIIICIILSLTPVLGAAQYPGLSGTRWISEAHSKTCALSQRMPASGGLVKFQQVAGKRLELTVAQHPLVTIGSESRIYSAPPLWRHNQPLTHLGTTQRKRGNHPFHVSADIAEKMLNSLSHGKAALFSYLEPALTGKEQILTLSPTFLYPALSDFQSCVQNLTPFNPDNFDLFEVHFRYGQGELGRQAQLRLAQFVDRLTKETDVTGLNITGFTDNGGHSFENLEMARIRALAVENYLLAAGVSADMLHLSYLGQAQPRYSNQTAAGRAGNRRVEIKIKR